LEVRTKREKKKILFAYLYLIVILVTLLVILIRMPGRPLNRGTCPSVERLCCCCSLLSLRHSRRNNVLGVLAQGIGVQNRTKHQAATHDNAENPQIEAQQANEEEEQGSHLRIEEEAKVIGDADGESLEL